MASLGEILRAQRERKGIVLVQAADDTRIRLKFLRALEDGDHNALPGAVYTKGFLRNYAEYLDLDPQDLMAAYNAERGVTVEPVRTFEPIRPILRRNLIMTPSVLVPAFVLAGVAFFVAYLYYQFTAFAVPPRIEVLDPPSDTIAQSADYVVRGRTVPEGRVTVRVFPGPETFNVRPAPDGTFSVSILLRPGANHVEVEVLDAAGKVSRQARAIRYEVAQSTVEETAPQLIVEQPSNGGTFTNAPVTVSGRVARVVTSVLVNGSPVSVGSDGRFTVTVNFTSGPQTVRVIARTATGGEVQETRAVSVSYSSAIVTVRIKGGNAWILATVDGSQAPNTNRVYSDGQTLSFTGKEVKVRTGNAATTFLTYNGQDLGPMGDPGLVTERTFTAQ
ncbi:MAG: DUF4115 domain-containing protein [Chloroflexi bacterium]|nr:DUF4115 domain-containing protein [Chloroflexota bacterium]